MTWYIDGFGGGETRDVLIDGCRYSTSTVGQPICDSGADIISTPVKNGVGALQLPAGASDAIILMSNIANTNTPVLRINCMQAWVNYNGNPAAAYYLMRFSAQSDLYGTRGWLLEVGTDRRVRIAMYVLSGVGNVLPVTPWSVGVLGNGSYTHLAWFLDPLTLGGHQADDGSDVGTNHTWATVLIDNVPQICADLGPWPYYLQGITSYGQIFGTVAANVDIRLDDVAGLHSTDIADAPHLAAAPIVEVAAQHPNAAGASDTWTMFPNTGEARYQDWDDATGNDGDTTYLQNNIESLQDSDFQSNSDVGMGASAVILENAAGVAPVYSIIHKSVSGSKWAGYTYCDAANQITLVDPGAAYAGALKPLTRTSGSWVDEDLATLKAGARILSGSDILWRITTLMLQWAYYDTTLPLTPAPMIPQSSIF